MRPLSSRAFWVVKRREAAVLGLLHRVRRGWMLGRVRLLAAWQRSTVDLEVAPDIRVDPHIKILVRPNTHSVVHIAPRCSLGERLMVTLDGGSLVLGEAVDIRRDVVLNVAGDLVLEGRNLLQVGTTIHCDEAVTLGRMTIVGERTTIVDSSHFYTTPDEWVLDNLKTAPVHVGEHCWIGAKVTIASGVRIGDSSIVSANSLVIGDVPAGQLASGVPARPVRPVSRP